MANWPTRQTSLLPRAQSLQNSHRRMLRQNFESPALSRGRIAATWPTFYKWELRKQKDGCWMIENTTPEPPPIDTVATDATPLLESESATAAP